MISNDISQAIQRHWHTAVALSDDLYAHPEIAHQEFRSSQKVVELLRRAGYQVEYPYMGYPTAFRGVLKNGEGPSAAILVEYDALPGLGHACGHNAHCAMASPWKGHSALAAARGFLSLIDARRESFTSDVRVNAIIADGGRLIGSLILRTLTDQPFRERIYQSYLAQREKKLAPCPPQN